MNIVYYRHWIDGNATDAKRAAESGQIGSVYRVICTYYPKIMIMSCESKQIIL